MKMSMRNTLFWGEIHGVTTQNIMPLIVTVVRTSNPIKMSMLKEI
jgi:hypothetical protein